jgi:iron complex outermembrane receptor protein
MRRRPSVTGGTTAAAVAAICALHAQTAHAARSNDPPASLQELSALSIEQLAQIDISSVSKTEEPLSGAPAAIFVITPEDIRRSGARSLPEILRLAPNLQVAQITASSFAISARGFNGSAADKLLVLIDGRSVYTPFHSGVFWDVQHVPPEDIERIEVISGPGATLWGANAVNGVINVITRKSSDTKGGLVVLNGGNLERRALVQVGGALGSSGSIRAYVSAMDRDDDVTVTGASAKDAWKQLQAGFRADWEGSAGQITLQGDIYTGAEHQFLGGVQDVWGHNIVARWTHPAGGGSLTLQAYYDRLHRSVTGQFSDDLSTYDIEAQHSFSLGRAHQVVWGGGYRATQDKFPIDPANPTAAPFVQAFVPQGRTLTLGNVFVQDTITLAAPLKLTLGLKLEKDPYIALEPLPSARLSWRVAEGHLIWASVSRAIRAPSRLDEDFRQTLGGKPYLFGGGFSAEQLIAYEAGYRTQPNARLTASISGFYNVYRDLRSFELSPGGKLPIMFRNLIEGETWGVEAWGSYQVMPWWRLTAGGNWLHKDLRFNPASMKLTSLSIAGNDPDYQLSLRSLMELSPQLTFDLALRRIGALPSPASPAYTELGARIAWAMTPKVELAITGANLLHDHHPEFGTSNAQLQLGSSGVESGRSVTIDARWRF